MTFFSFNKTWPVFKEHSVLEKKINMNIRLISNICKLLSSVISISVLTYLRFQKCNGFAVVLQKMYSHLSPVWSGQRFSRKQLQELHEIDAILEVCVNIFYLNIYLQRPVTQYQLWLHIWPTESQLLILNKQHLVAVSLSLLCVTAYM